MKKLLFIFFLALLLLPLPSLAENNCPDKLIPLIEELGFEQKYQNIIASKDSGILNIYVFWWNQCPHCASEKLFLADLEKEDDYKDLINIYDFEVSNEPNSILFEKVIQANNLQAASVPITIIGEEVIIGYGGRHDTGETIEHAIKSCLGLSIFPKDESKKVIPIIGEIDLQNFSLPILTILIAGVDGFNPCAMWVLLFLITLLLGMQNKRRMWILGIAFILTSGFVYFLFLTAWLNAFLILGFEKYIQMAIGVVAVVSGIIHLRDFYRNQIVCKVIDPNKRNKITSRLKSVVEANKFYLALAGIILVAFAVNLVELFCSLGLPAVYTEILTIANLPAWQYYLYLILYVIIFMLDDMLVFSIAMITLNATGISAKYTRWANLIGGIVILAIGILLIFYPQLLLGNI